MPVRTWPALSFSWGSPLILPRPPQRPHRPRWSLPGFLPPPPLPPFSLLHPSSLLSLLSSPLFLFSSFLPFLPLPSYYEHTHLYVLLIWVVVFGGFPFLSVPLLGFMKVIVCGLRASISHCSVCFYCGSSATIHAAILPALDVWALSRCQHSLFQNRLCEEQMCFP